MQTQASFRRLAKDHAALQSSLPPNYLFPERDDASSIPDDLTQLLVLVTGAESTPYSQGLWRLHLKIPNDYPKNPPKATFKTRIFHPNVDESSGAVCLETLKRDWDPKLTLGDILITISCLLIQPNPDSALNAAAGSLIQEDYEAFSRQAKLMTKIHAPIPTHLVTAVQEAKRRGEDGNIAQENPTIVSQPLTEGNDTKQNGQTQSFAEATNAQLDMRTSVTGKRPLSEPPSASGQQNEPPLPSTQSYAEPVRKSPKRSEADMASSVKFMSSQAGFRVNVDEKENLIVAGKQQRNTSFPAGSRPIVLRKVSNVGPGKRGPPRLGIRRL